MQETMASTAVERSTNIQNRAPDNYPDVLHYEVAELKDNSISELTNEAWARADNTGGQTVQNARERQFSLEGDPIGEARGVGKQIKTLREQYGQGVNPADWTLVA